MKRKTPVTAAGRRGIVTGSAGVPGWVLVQWAGNVHAEAMRADTLTPEGATDERASMDHDETAGQVRDLPAESAGRPAGDVLPVEPDRPLRGLQHEGASNENPATDPEGMPGVPQSRAGAAVRDPAERPGTDRVPDVRGVRHAAGRGEPAGTGSGQLVLVGQPSMF